MSKTTELAEKLAKLDIANMYENDFFLTWEKTDDEIEAVFTVADALRDLRERNKSSKIFDSGLGISIFRDNSTRTRFSFASACNLLGLEVQDLDEKKSQIAHGETVRETATMISFMADVIGIRDDMYIGKGNAYMHEVVDSVKQAARDGELEQKPTLVNLQCDIDHPTQSLADALHIIHEFGGVENLKGKKIAMSWAYSPSYGKPLSVPQGIIGLLTRFGMDVVLAHPEGYEVMSDVVEVAKKNAAESGGSFSVTNDMKEAFKDADASTKFTDVDANAYYAKAIDWAVENGITSGKTDTTFDPNGKVTRAEAVTFLYRYFAANQSYNAADFTDVASTAYYANAVGWASSNGVTQGKTATTFAPNDTTTRKEAAAFIYRARNWQYANIQK